MTPRCAGVVIGIAFFDIGSKPPINQLSFIFLVLQMAVIGQLQGMDARSEAAGLTFSRSRQQ